MTFITFIMIVGQVIILVYLHIINETVVKIKITIIKEDFWTEISKQKNCSSLFWTTCSSNLLFQLKVLEIV